MKAAHADAALEIGASALREALSKVGCPQFAWLRVLAEPFEAQDESDEGEDGSEEGLELESAHEVTVPGSH